MESPFHPHTKESWLEAVKKELPDGTLPEDLAIGNQLFDHDGFAWPSAMNETDGLIPTPEWKITAACNSHFACMSALQDGAEAIIITPESGKEVQHYLDGVGFEFITTLIHSVDMQDNDKTNWRQTLSSVAGQSPIIWYSERAGEDEFQHIHSPAMHRTDFLKCFESMVNQGSSQNKGWLITHQFGADFYSEIAWARAMREAFMIWQKKSQQHHKIYLVAQLDAAGSDLNQDLIRYSYQCLSAVLAGYDFISGPTWQEGDNKYARLVLNIQHLMKHESKLHLFRDPMAGSYFIEEICRSLVNEALEKLKL